MNNIEKAAHFLRNEDVVAIPTETVYGLAGNAFSDKAIKRIFEVKNRPFYNPLIVHIKSIDELNKIATNIPEMAFKLAEVFWPGPLTLVLDKQPSISDLVTGGKPTVAVRLPAHPVALELLNYIDFPLVAPSANPFNYLSPTSAQHVKEQLGNKIPYILDGGNCEKGVESTIIGFQDNSPILYRLGAISMEDIEEVTGELTTQNQSKNSPNAPGMLSKHYSPKTQFILSNNITQTLESLKDKKVGVITFNESRQDYSVFHQVALSYNNDLKEAASNLFSTLHHLDKMKLDAIVAERLPDEGLGKTINDRLQRAASKG
ncbi:L-threonylcarbamoyladenylate synthase [Carboxylicivirga linearis]|uniref:Threonylcarbamoyl-AMP synthase n=1 Tax=Carboxylicivirga linearis TaxID=1628157 RepID=A0ABS5K086_9BACT|nr:L-threonylcarbamoyladenylate synthase [Carboxylicivirga linearis]MBS2100001.1 threonylcarbamoyl-AMP synthase [Carboxylicivirga linearis]